MAVGASGRAVRYLSIPDPSLSPILILREIRRWGAMGRARPAGGLAGAVGVGLAPVAVRAVSMPGPAVGRCFLGRMAVSARAGPAGLAAGARVQTIRVRKARPPVAAANCSAAVAVAVTAFLGLRAAAMAAMVANLAVGAAAVIMARVVPVGILAAGAAHANHHAPVPGSQGRPLSAIQASSRESV